MFASACRTIREALYGIIGTSVVGPNAVNASNGTAFMIAPGVLATAAHIIHIESDPAKRIHPRLEVIGSPHIGETMEAVDLIAEDAARDLALLRIRTARSTSFVTLTNASVASGTSCGSLGFPLAQVVFGPGGKMFSLVERFQGANVSSFHPLVVAGGSTYWFYETDSLMYGGSSGCPGFLQNGDVFAMHVTSIVQSNAPAPPAQGTGGVHKVPPGQIANRLAIALWVPAGDIIAFAKTNGIEVSAA